MDANSEDANSEDITYVHDVTISRNVRWVLSCSAFPIATCHVWDARNGKLIISKNESRLLINGALDRGMVISDDCRRAVLGSGAPFINVWDFARNDFIQFKTGESVCEERESVGCLDMSTDGKRIAWGTWSRVHIWDDIRTINHVERIIPSRESEYMIYIRLSNDRERFACLSEFYSGKKSSNATMYKSMWEENSSEDKFQLRFRQQIGDITAPKIEYLGASGSILLRDNGRIFGCWNAAGVELDILTVERQEMIDVMGVDQSDSLPTPSFVETITNISSAHITRYGYFLQLKKAPYAGFIRLLT